VPTSDGLSARGTPGRLTSRSWALLPNRPSRLAEWLRGENPVLSLAEKWQVKNNCELYPLFPVQKMGLQTET